MFSRIAQSVLFMTLISLSVLAQTQTAPGPQEQTGRTSIIIDRQLVRFAAPGEAVEWHLVVTDQQGEVIFDSGYFHGEALEWPLKDQQGELIASGLYAYTLTTKAITEATARTQRGHLIIDRASSADRVWVTSSPEVSLGTASEARKVTVVGGGDQTVGGAELPRERPARSPSDPRATARQVDSTKADGRKTQANAVASGIWNRIAKFDFDGETLVNSTMIETPTGDIGIGTTAPGGVLDLQRSSSGDILQRFWNTGSGAGAGAKLRFVAATGATSQLQLTDGLEWLMSIAGNKDIGMQFRVRNTSDANTEAGLAGAARMTIARNGNVGIGTTSPATTLDVRSLVDNGNGVINATNTAPGGPGVFAVGGNASPTLGGGSGLLALGGTGNKAPGGVGLVGFGGSSSDGSGGTGGSLIGGVSTSGNGGDGLFAVGALGVGTGKKGGRGIVAIPGGGAGGATAGLAGEFIGNVTVSGNLSKGGGSFKIDHPLDPANKYLYHSFVESPDMKNIYDGTVTTDADGEAVVTLPDYFEALNSDFRYQLTVIGTFAQAIVADEIRGNSFRIRTSAPNVKVSWQVTGIRQDAYANAYRIPVEEEKPDVERGSYLRPELFNQPEERSVEWARHPEQMRQMKERREQAHEKAQPDQ